VFYFKKKIVIRQEQHHQHAISKYRYQIIQIRVLIFNLTFRYFLYF